MRTGRAIALACAFALAPSVAWAQEAPVRIQNRLLKKDGRVFVNAGGTLLDRADYFSNPGVLASASWYLGESDAIELRFSWFFSQLSPAGREIVQQTQLVPEAHRPVALALLGWRHSVGYGKVLVGNTVVHFDLQLAAHGGALHAERMVDPSGAGARVYSPALGASPGAVVRVGERFHAQLDLGAMLAFEQRSRASLDAPPRGTFALGFLPSLTLGASL